MVEGGFTPGPTQRCGGRGPEACAAARLALRSIAWAGYSRTDCGSGWHVRGSSRREQAQQGLSMVETFSPPEDSGVLLPTAPSAPSDGRCP